MPIPMLPRRRFVPAIAAATAAPASAGGAKAAEGVRRAKQFHNQPAQSHLHRFLVDLWTAVREETGGRLDVTVHAQNDGIPGSDPGALDMLAKGDLEFFTLMGGILGRVAPAMEIQGMPFAFASHAQVHRANDGALGEHLSRECEAKGIHRFRHGLMENGFRHIGMVGKPIRSADDLAGVRMRVPDGEMFRDLFATLGAVPVTVNIRDLYAALKENRVDGQENPLVVTEFNRLYEVTPYMSLTGHMWSGFNMLANLRFWNRLPDDVRAAVDRNVARHVALQRAYTDDLNRRLEAELAGRGMAFNTASTESFRKLLAGGFYPRWRRRLGPTAWSLLEGEVGALG